MGFGGRFVNERAGVAIGTESRCRFVQDWLVKPMERADIHDDFPNSGEGAMSDAGRLIIVDDEPDIRSMVAEYLGRNGFVVRAAADGSELDGLLTEYFPDLLILDINMPGEDGLAIARRIRARSTMPILMLTAADDIVDRVVGLEVGADDYLTKPFDLRELRARIRAILRRAAERTAPAVVGPAASSAPPIRTASHVPFGRVSLDIEAHRVVASDGTEIALTPTEFDLLEAFAKHPNRVLSREQLLDLAHNRGSDVFDRSIDIRIARIRRKIEQDPSNPQTIKTVRGAGYIFKPEKS
jgi:DNA-binding response OmpR family regulator